MTTSFPAAQREVTFVTFKSHIPPPCVLFIYYLFISGEVYRFVPSEQLRLFTSAASAVAESEHHQCLSESLIARCGEVICRCAPPALLLRDKNSTY